MLVNPGGAFLVGGPRRDAGLTGRKNVVDTYGGFARQGGGALSGKDPAHVDRFGAYMARYMARNVVAAGLPGAARCSSATASARCSRSPSRSRRSAPARWPTPQIERAIERLVDLTPATIVETFDLRALPERHGGEFYRTLAAYGHFGRTDLDAPWEREDLASPLRRAASRKA